MNGKDFWYIIAQSQELKRDSVIAAQVLGEWLAVFRDASGTAVALEDCCLHRCARLSKGAVSQGRLQCSYHGWVYNGQGSVVEVPSEGDKIRPKPAARTFQVCEIDDYVYARLSEARDDDIKPFRIPFYQAPGWGAIRLKNLFKNTVTNCVENFVDIPHTAFVHPKIFRVTKNEKLTASVERKAGSVTVNYRGERANLGFFSWFLNARGKEIGHRDAFFMPNVTSVDYIFNDRRRFIITSQCIPLSDDETLVYTDLTYDYGIWNRLAKPIIRRQAQTIINQDIEILGNQMQTINKFGARFNNSEADVIHVFIESIRQALERGEDPRRLPDKNIEIEFWV